jgi:hypothetical protein
MVEDGSDRHLPLHELAEGHSVPLKQFAHMALVNSRESVKPEDCRDAAGGFEIVNSDKWNYKAAVVQFAGDLDACTLNVTQTETEPLTQCE